MKFACVDGPDFDGHKVDFDELMNRNSLYREHEAAAKENHACRLEDPGQAADDSVRGGRKHA